MALEIKMLSSWIIDGEEYPVHLQLQIDSDDPLWNWPEPVAQELNDLGLKKGIDYEFGKTVLPSRLGIHSNFVSLCLKSNEQLTLFKMKYHG